MPSIDERVVSMAFENAVFEQRVAVTMTTLSKLNSALANVGAVNGLAGIERAANQVTLAAPMSAMDKLRAKFGLGVNTAPITDIEKSGSKVTLEAPMSALDKLRAKLGRGVDAKPISDIEKAGQNVTLAQPVKAVDNLQNKLDKGIDPRSISNLERAGQNVTFEGPSRALDTLTAKFSTLQAAAAVAFGNIASQAALKGGALAKSFSIGPLRAGLEEYSTNLNSIQTILANTEGQKVSGLDQVNKHLQELNKYSDQTIYNFSEMAKNIGTFTAAGVDLETSTKSIKGIANLAALSGSNSQQAGTAMYQLSQAIAAGKVGLQDWNSVVNAGMGGAIFQKALARTAVTMGTVKDGALEIDKATGKATINGESFRESIMAKPGQKSWLTSEVLTTTLKNFTGDMKEADLIAQGFSKSQAALIMKQAATAKAAATEVKTLSGVFDVVKESIGSGWAQTFQLIFGDFEEAKTLFTNVTSYITGWTGKVSDARNKMLGDWKKAGGRDDLLAGLKAGFEALMSVIKPVKDAFRTVFPATTGKQLAQMTKDFREFMEGLKLGSGTAENLKRTFAGVFAVLHIGWTIIKDVAKVFFDLLGVVGKGSGGFLNFTGGIGDFLVALDKAISKGNALGGFFKGLTNILRIPIELIKSAARAIAGLFGGDDNASRVDRMNELVEFGKVLTPIERGINRVKEAWKKFGSTFRDVKKIISPWLDQVIESLKSFGTVIADAIKNIDFDKVLLAFQTTFLGGIFLTLKKAIEGGGISKLGGGIFKNINESLQGLTGTLTAMQKQVQATTLLTIATAIVALALGVKLLSTIDPKKMTTAMTAIAVGMGELGGALAIMTSKLGKTGIVTMPIIATSMLILAGAIIVLAAAMKIMSTMSWEEIGKGLAGVGGALTTVGVAIKFINPATIIPIAAGMLLMAGALVILATATKIFGEMSWEELAKGLIGLAWALGTLTAAMIALGIGLSVAGPMMLLIGPSIIAAAVGLTILAGAVSAFGAMDLAQLGKGLLGMVGALAVLAVTMAAFGAVMYVLGPTLLLVGPAIILASVGLGLLAGAIGIMGKLKLGTLIKGLIGMGAALGILAVGLYLMIGSLPGAVALLAAGAAFAILGPALAFLGVLPWSVILKGLAAIALSMGIIAVVGLVAAPALLALGGALAVLGVGLVLVGTAIYIAAKGLALLGENGAKGIGVLVSAITAFVALLPSLVINFVKGLVSIFEEVAKVAPKVVLALGVILDTVIAFVIEQAPKLAKAVNALITAILNVIATNAGPMIQAGWRLIQQLLSGIASNIGSVVTKVGEIITRFLNALSGQMPKIVQAGVRLLGSFLSGVSASLPRIIASAANVIVKFLQGVTQQLPKIVAKAGQVVTTYINAVARQIPRIIAAGARLIVSFINGIGNAIPRIIAAGARLIIRFVDGIAKTLPRVVDAGFKAIIRFLNGIARAIRQNDDQLIDAGANILNALIDGVVKAAGRLGGPLKRAIEGLFGLLPGWARRILGIHSPSTIFQEIGQNTILGFTKGIEDSSPDLNRAISDSTTSMVDTAKSTLSGANMLDGIIDAEPVITPILDLSGVEKEADKLSGLTNVTPITAAASYGQASTIAGEQQAAQLAETIQLRSMLASAPPAVKFEQNNYSPESLSHVEIYRQTNNQLAQAKRTLGVDPGRLYSA